VLGLWQGATGNATVAKVLLEDLVARGLNQERRLNLGHARESVSLLAETLHQAEVG